MSASSAASAPPALELRDCSVAYGAQPALHGIDLVVQPGERVALVGPSGAGKTTLLRTLYRSAPQRCALVAQAYDLVPQLPVRANVDAGRLDQRGLLHNLGNLIRPRRADREAVAALLAELGLAGTERRRVGELSGGQQQRVAIARALYAGRPVLLADEPVSAVDPARAESVLELLLARSETCVLAMHAITPVLQRCSRVLGLHAGRLVFDLPTAEVDDARLAALFAVD